MIKRFLHLAVTTTDLENSISMYEALGMKEVERFESTTPQASVVLMEDQNGNGIELWQFIDSSDPNAEIIADHTAYETDDLSEDAASLLSKGFTEAMPSGEDNTLKFVILRSQNGKIIELCEYKNQKL